MNFLVTGITGFAGPHLARLLINNGHKVWGLIRGSNGRETDLLDVLTEEELKSINWVFGDLNDSFTLDSLFKQTKFYGVFHLAAQSHPPTSFSQPVLTWNVNVMGSLNLITSISEMQPECILHFCSTSEVYGDACAANGELKESMNLTPANPYGASKAAIDMYMQERITNKKLKGFVTRAFSHTGPRRGYNFSISSDAYQIAKMMLGLQDKELLIGNLKTKRVVIDVRDCVRAYYQLMMAKSSGVYNVCGTEVREMQFFTDQLIDLSKLEDIEQKLWQPFYRPIDIEVQIGDITELKKVINWQPEIPIRRTLSNLLTYWLRKLK